MDADRVLGLPGGEFAVSPVGEVLGLQLSNGRLTQTVALPVGDSNQLLFLTALAGGDLFFIALEGVLKRQDGFRTIDELSPLDLRLDDGAPGFGVGVTGEYFGLWRNAYATDDNLMANDLAMFVLARSYRRHCDQIVTT